MFLICVQSIQGFIVLKEGFWAKGELCTFGNIFFFIFLQAENRIHLIKLHFMWREAAVFPWFERDGVSMG